VNAAELREIPLASARRITTTTSQYDVAMEA
jgi:hypothetical protein